MYVEVLVENRVSSNDMTFTYHVPSNIKEDLVGRRVLVPFNNRNIEGFVLYYTAGCPYTAKYGPIIEECAKQNGSPFKRVLIDSREKAQNAPVVWTNYAMFYNGKYVTNEILSEKKFLALAESLK